MDSRTFRSRIANGKFSRLGGDRSRGLSWRSESTNSLTYMKNVLGQNFNNQQAIEW